MSIVTKTGDTGATALMYGRKVSKTHPRIEACGVVDELNAALGLALSLIAAPAPREPLLLIQKDLVILMGELAVLSEDLPRYLKDGFATVTPAMTTRVEQWLRQMESAAPGPGDWAMPGGTQGSAAVDVARTVCRRAERRVCALVESGEIGNRELLVYLNRLSDLLWVLARNV